MSTASAAPSRLRAKYNDEIRASLKEEFGFKSIMQVPVLEKVTVNMGVGDAKQDRKILENATQQLAQITGQQPNPRRARKSIANFKLREEMVVGVSVTLRGDRAFEFIDRVISIALPRLRDFSGLKRTSFDGRGNYSFGIKEQVIFPEIDYDKIDATRGMDVTITTSAKTDAEALALLIAIGLPFTKENSQNG
ncbi:MAG: 50S ribosomal protein L5 [Solirubrobacteraceae bacterium]|nr:50S ribosomal protein L5 [Patulibacter sp.]